MANQTIGGLSNNGAVPKATGVLSGSYNPNQRAVSLGNSQPSSQSNSTALSSGQFGGQTQPTIGTNPGLLPGVNSSSQQKKVITDVSGNKTEVHPAQSNPSVLAQQQALNKQGAGLVEDGIAGPRTSAAIAKYSTAGTPTPTPTPQPEPQKPTTPQVGSAKENAQGVLNSGQQTSQEKETYSGLLNTANEANDPNGRIALAYKEKQDLENAYATQQKAIQGSPIPLEFQQGRGQVLANQYGSQLNAAQTGISNALAGQGQQISGLNSANSAAQNTANRTTSTAGTVLNASIPQQISGSARTYNPLDPTGTTGANGIIQGQNNQSVADLTTQYNNNLTNLNAADLIQKQITNTLNTNPTLNQTPISAITNLKELLSGQTSAPGQQILAQQINSYITKLGIDPATAVNIASQQQGTLAQLLDSLRQTAQANNDAIKKTRDGLTNSSNSSGSTTGGNSTGYANGGAF